MTKKQSTTGQQRQFLFVFSSSNSQWSDRITDSSSMDSIPSTELDCLEAEILRKKLIAELKKFGC